MTLVADRNLDFDHRWQLKSGDGDCFGVFFARIWLPVRIFGYRSVTELPEHPREKALPSK
jgi:hypothetical protein